MKLLILASGKGSRLNKLTKKKPKCLVNVLNKPIISYLTPSFDLFTQVIFVVGYKSDKIKAHLRNYSNLTFVDNLNFCKTNMVESLFLAKDYIDDDVIISYSDIIFDLNILKELRQNKYSTIPIYKNWLSLWQKRMKKKEIINDAEDLKIKNKKITSIGGKILKVFPQYQFMGILKLNKNDFKKLYKFYLSINDKSIDLTSFLNESISNKILNLYYSKTTREWIEIDSEKDLCVAEKILKFNPLTDNNTQQF